MKGAVETFVILFVNVSGFPKKKKICHFKWISLWKVLKNHLEFKQIFRCWCWFLLLQHMYNISLIFGDNWCIACLVFVSMWMLYIEIIHLDILLLVKTKCSKLYLSLVYVNTYFVNSPPPPTPPYMNQFIL